MNYASWPEVLIIQGLEGGVFALIFNEPFFLLINFILSLLLDEENVVRTIIFFGSFTTSYLILRYNYRYFLLLLFFLLIPQVLKNYVIHLRQGLAMSFFLIGYLSKSKNNFKSLFFIWISPFIHSSFFVLVFLIYLIKIFEIFKFDITLKILMVAFFGIIFSFTIETLGQLSGARQATQYEFTSADISGLGFLFWFLVLVIFTFQGRDFLTSNLFSFAILIFYLMTYFFIPVTARIFESGIVLVLLSSLSLRNWRRYTFFGLIFVYSAYNYLSQIDSPYFGWAIS